MSSPENADRRRVQRAALSVGAWVAAASALVIFAIVGALVLVILLRARVESDEHPFPSRSGARDGDALVVDVDHLLPWVICLGVVGVVVLSLAAWVAARRSVRPLGEALRLQRNFVADASHELRTPLTTLTSRIQIAQRRLERGGDVAESLQQLRYDAAAMNDILTDLLLAAEPDRGPVEPTSLEEATDAAAASLQPLADDAGVRLAVAAEPARVQMPRTALVRVLVAVIDNAIQHSPFEGTVRVVATAGTDTVAVRVTDQGGGIAGADTERLFERFARGAESGRRRGFGLGLALARDTLTRYGGRVEVESTSGAGTTFLLTLPVAAD